jgi:hypothetical protein
MEQVVSPWALSKDSCGKFLTGSRGSRVRNPPVDSATQRWPPDGTAMAKASSPAG